jgi:long-chain acyl-CoA synthetase
MIQENLIKLFESSFRDNWDLSALTDYNTKRTYTYQEMATEIAKIHLLFKELNIKQNDKIALVGRNTPTWGITLCSIITYGAIAIPILQDFHPDDIHHIVNHSDSALLFLSDNIWDSLEEEKLPELRGIFSLTDFRCLHQKDGESIQKTMKSLDKLFDSTYPDGFQKEHLDYAQKDNSELAVINYTSGTTGFSKGVMLTGNNLAGNITFGFRTNLTGKGYRILTFLPLAHAYACAFDFLTQMCSGAHVTFLNKIPSPKILLKAFEEVRPNVIFTVPLVIEKIYKKQILPMLAKRTMRLALSIPLLDQKILSEIRKKLVDAFGSEFVEIVIGGAPFNKETEDFLLRIKFPFTVGYGMTECAPLISYSPHDKFIPGSVGKVLDIMEVKIDSEDPYSKAGEICVRGENVMCGYYKNEAATQQTLQEDGWLRTGDIGTIDKDCNIFIKGRCKTMLLSPNGQNIYPEEIEAKLINMPFVSECIVTQKNDKLVALVYPDLDAMDESRISNKELEIIMEANRKELNTQIASFEAITKINLYPNEFEKTPKKSIKRYLYENLS